MQLEVTTVLVVMWGWAAMPLGVLALPDGPPLSACTDMRPGTRMGVVGMEGHTGLPQNILPTYGNKREPPYYIQIHGDRSYVPGQSVIRVSVVANQSVSLQMYKGLLLEARTVICASNVTSQVDVEEFALGEFTVPLSSDGGLLKTLDCQNKLKSAVGHKSPQIKINETFTWRPPLDLTGPVVFRATVVQIDTIYWTEVHSAVLTDPSLARPRTCGATRIHPTLTVVIATLLFFLNYILSS